MKIFVYIGPEGVRSLRFRWILSVISEPISFFPYLYNICCRILNFPPLTRKIERWGVNGLSGLKPSSDNFRTTCGSNTNSFWRPFSSTPTHTTLAKLEFGNPPIPVKVRLIGSNCSSDILFLISSISLGVCLLGK